MWRGRWVGSRGGSGVSKCCSSLSELGDVSADLTLWLQEDKHESCLRNSGYTPSAKTSVPEWASERSRHSAQQELTRVEGSLRVCAAYLLIWHLCKKEFVIKKKKGVGRLFNVTQVKGNWGFSKFCTASDHYTPTFSISNFCTCFITRSLPHRISTHATFIKLFSLKWKIYKNKTQNTTLPLDKLPAVLPSSPREIRLRSPLPLTCLAVQSESRAVQYSTVTQFSVREWHSA